MTANPRESALAKAAHVAHLKQATVEGVQSFSRCTTYAFACGERICFCVRKIQPETKWEKA
jgi:hypothetical protein